MTKELTAVDSVEVKYEDNQIREPIIIPTYNSRCCRCGGELDTVFRCIRCGQRHIVKEDSFF